MTTIRDIAAACGVAPQTVMSVIHNIPGKVSVETRARVLQAVRDMDYRPGAPRRRATAQKTHTIGMVGGWTSPCLMGVQSYYTDITTGAVVAAGEMKHNVLLFVSDLLYKDPMADIRLYCDGRCDGLVVIEPWNDSPLITALLERGIPVVSVGHYGQYSHPLSIVDVDNRQGMRDIVRALVSAGHRRIAFAGWDRRHSASIERKDYFLQSLREYGVAAPEHFVHLPEETSEYEEITPWLRSVLSLPDGERPTAIAAWNDITAGEIIRVANGMGLNVPADLSVTGFDDDPTVTSKVALTTVRQPYAQIGRRAIELLVDTINGVEMEHGRVIIPGELIMRQTIAPPPSGSQDGE
ncbi:LacI family transcriptional regulator [Capsulimonas corticalis]|uniref:LacI family transcriptional regulator n=1 Tax=Capsulimonas corticalis TaxID=2219043 RepID=A0A402D5X5_9BACT|nr:LacI family DNA-binding transcriptional regulator [Capsulimonas corticalis]BDI32531.1 LacI family transcriptional regulator [Capsulimonas corticalis]